MTPDLREFVFETRRTQKAIRLFAKSRGIPLKQKDVRFLALQSRQAEERRQERQCRRFRKYSTDPGRIFATSASSLSCFAKYLSQDIRHRRRQRDLPHRVLRRRFCSALQMRGYDLEILKLFGLSCLSGQTLVEFCLGGNHPYVSAETELGEKYSKHQFRRTNGVLTLALRADYPEQVVKKGLALLDGIFTVHAELVDSVVHEGLILETYRAVWATKSRGFSVNTEKGWISVLRNGERIQTSYHSVNSKDASKKGVTRKYRQQNQSSRRSSGTSRRKRQVFRLARHLLCRNANLMSVEVSFTDSLQAGNCFDGTLSFAERYAQGRSSAPLSDVVPSFLDDIRKDGLRVHLSVARQFLAAILRSLRRQKLTSVLR